jgi:anti-anti-sigma factor
MKAPCEVKVVNRNGQAIVSVSGEMDPAAAAHFREILRTAQQGSADVIVDLSRMTFIDTTGISALVGARKKAPDRQFHVVGVTKQIRRVFEITGVASYLSGDDSQTRRSRSLDDAAIKAPDG